MFLYRGKQHGHIGAREMATFVLIPGGWQGGWAFEKVADLLVAHGHNAHPLTLAVLGDMPAPSANLALHISEAVRAIENHHDELVLVGHSYGGMVVSGAADAARANIRALVYSDAYVPESGDSVWSLTSPRFRDTFIAGVAADGLTCAPPPNLDPRCRPHPIGTFLQAIDLGGRWHNVLRKPFVGAHDGKEARFSTSTGASAPTPNGRRLLSTVATIFRAYSQKRWSRYCWLKFDGNIEVPSDLMVNRKRRHTSST